MSDITRRKVEPDLDEDLKQILKSLRLNGLLERWDEYLAAARQDHFSHERLLKHILQKEHRSSQEHARLLRRKRAKIPELWEMETFPFERQPKLDRRRIMSLYDSFDFMRKNQDVIWIGPTGCGKTGLATSFLVQAIDRGYRGRFVTFPDLLSELYASLADHSQRKVLKRYLSYDCLLIDEVGYVDVEPVQVGLFFALMQKCHQRRTTLITSNPGFVEWGDFLKNTSLTGALLDRLTATSHVFHLKGCISQRLKLNARRDAS